MNSITHNVTKLALTLTAVFISLLLITPNPIYASTGGNAEIVISSADEPVVAQPAANVLSSATEPMMARNRADSGNETSSASEPANVLSSATEPEAAHKARGTSPYVHVIGR